MGKDKKTGDLTRFADKARISIGYASQLIAGKRTPTVEMALIIYRRTKRLFGILNGASTREANMLLGMAERTGTIPEEEEPKLPMKEAA